MREKSDVEYREFVDTEEDEQQTEREKVREQRGAGQCDAQASGQPPFVELDNVEQLLVQIHGESQNILHVERRVGNVDKDAGEEGRRVRLVVRFLAQVVDLPVDHVGQRFAVVFDPRIGEYTNQQAEGNHPHLNIRHEEDVEEEGEDGDDR